MSFEEGTDLLENSLLVNCPGCSTSVDASSGICCDLCGCYSHINCVGVSPEEVPIISRIHRRSPHVKLLCVNCKQVFNSPALSPIQVSSPLEENAFLKYIRNIIDSAITPLRKEISTLRESLCKVNSDNKITYADKLKEVNEAKVVIKPKDKQSCFQTKCDILKSVQPFSENIDINVVKPVANGGLVIGCSASTHSDKFIELAEEKLSNKYNVKKLSPILPRLRVVGISEDINETDFVSYLKKQNQDVLGDQPELNINKLWPVKSNSRIYQAEISVDIDSYKRLLEKGNILIGLNGCSVYDAVSVTRCYRCCGFNHTAKNCKNNIVCSLCSKAHDRSSCTIVSDEDRRCKNCLNLREKQKLDVNINHAAFDSNKCTALLLAISKLKSDLFGIKTVVEVNKLVDDVVA